MKANHQTLIVLGIISASVLFTPFILWNVWNLVKGWGKWRIRKSGNRPHYVRTWHGWVEAEKAATRAVERAKLRNHNRQKRIWRTTTADYSWIFWDPSGVKQQEYEDNRKHSILRHLPRWLRSDEPGSLWPDARITPNRLGDAEEGTVSLRSFRHSCEIQPRGFSFTGNQSWLRSSSKKGADTLTENHTLSDCLPMMTGALEDSRSPHSMSTVRRRKFAMGRFQVWDANSQETFRATCTQFLAPKQTGSLGADVDPARESGALALRVQPSLAAQNVDPGFAPRASSLPLFATLRNAYNARSWLKIPMKTLPVRSPKKQRAGFCNDDNAPENPDDLQGSGMTTRLRNPEGNLPASMPPYERMLMQTFNQRFEPLAKPVVLNPFTSIGTEYSGTTGRPGSPIMGWTIKGDPRASVSELNHYEAEGPVKGASTFSCSSYSSASSRSRSNGEYPVMRLDEANLQKTKDSTATSNFDTFPGRASHSARGVCVSDGVFQGSYSPGDIALHFSLQPRSTSGKNLTSDSNPRAPPRSRKVTSDASVAEPSPYIEKLSMSLHVEYGSKTRDSFYPPRRITSKSTTRVPFDVAESSTQTRSPTKSSTRSAMNSASGTSKLSEAKKATAERTGCLSSVEKVFLNDLDLRLSRLDYELSPGFRGPQGDGTSPRWWFEAAPYAASLASRSLQSLGNHTKARMNPLNPTPVLRRSHTALDMSKTIDTTFPTVLRRRASLQDSVLLRGTSRYREEPGEGTIDTAAWMLRRPPMGPLREDSAEKTLRFTSGRGSAKTLLEWQQSEFPLPLQQAFDSAAAISKRPAKHLKRLVSRNRNDGCKAEKQLARAAVDGEDVEDHFDERSGHTTSPVTGKNPIQRIFFQSIGAFGGCLTTDERIDRDSPMGYSSPHRTMMH